MQTKKLSIKVTHIGHDYGTVTVAEDDGITEYEIPLGLAKAMQEKAARIQAALNGSGKTVEQRIAEGLGK